MPDFHAPDGTRLHYEEAGTGTPVIALAGLTRNARDFDHVAPHLDCRLIRMDYRGRGRSEFSGPDTYTVPTEAQDALALMDHLGLPKAAILGTSRGGLIAMTLAAMAKDRLLGVALNDIGPEVPEPALAFIRAYVGQTPPQRTWDEAAAVRQSMMVQFPGVPLARWRAEVEGYYDQTPDGLTLRYDPALRQSMGDGSEPMPDLWPLYDALAGLPLAILRGANSDLLTPAIYAEMTRRRPDAIAAEVPDRGHVPFLDEPASLDVLQRWLEAIR